MGRFVPSDMFKSKEEKHHESVFRRAFVSNILCDSSRILHNTLLKIDANQTTKKIDCGNIFFAITNRNIFVSMPIPY